MTKCKGFKTFKERGEWVELQFMACAVWNGFKVSKPWGDSSAYDVGIESGERILRVQVKSTDCRTQYGYLCQFKPNAHSQPYTLKQVDFFAAYVIPEDVWYLIPAGVLLRGKLKKAVTLLPEKPRHPDRYKYEGYRGAWVLLLPIEEKNRVEEHLVGRPESKFPPPISPRNKERQGGAVARRENDEAHKLRFWICPESNRGRKI